MAKKSPPGKQPMPFFIIRNCHDFDEADRARKVEELRAMGFLAEGQEIIWMPKYTNLLSKESVARICGTVGVRVDEVSREKLRKKLNNAVNSYLDQAVQFEKQPTAYTERQGENAFLSHARNTLEEAIRVIDGLRPWTSNKHPNDAAIAAIRPILEGVKNTQEIFGRLPQPNPNNKKRPNTPLKLFLHDLGEISEQLGVKRGRASSPKQKTNQFGHQILFEDKSSPFIRFSTAVLTEIDQILANEIKPKSLRDAVNGDPSTTVSNALRKLGGKTKQQKCV